MRRKEGEERVGLERRRPGLLVSSGDKHEPQRNLPGRGIVQRFWVLGSGRALCQKTDILRVAKSQDTQGHIARALWVQAQQDRKPSESGLDGPRPLCLTFSLLSTASTKPPGSPATRVPTPPGSTHFHSDHRMSEHFNSVAQEATLGVGGVPAFSEVCRSTEGVCGWRQHLLSSRGNLFTLTLALHIHTPSRGGKHYHGDGPVTCPSMPPQARQ